MKGHTYKVHISKDENKYYSLKQAVDHGFQASGNMDGRKNRHKRKPEPKK